MTSTKKWRDARGSATVWDFVDGGLGEKLWRAGRGYVVKSELVEVP